MRMGERTVDTTSPRVLAFEHGAMLSIVLNRPEALNALSLDMIEAMRDLLDRFEADPSVAIVLLRGAGERGLCAGGDIRTLYNSALKPDGWPEEFWPKEYALNARIGSYAKPYIAFMDGIVMGGGIGVSAHGSHRIVTERTKVAMPEVGIGIIPDVGGTWLLSRKADESGTFLALTGQTVTGSDAIAAGLADFYVPSSSLETLARDLAALPGAATAQDVSRTIRAHEAARPGSMLEANAAIIAKCFAFDTVEAIEAALEKAGTPFAKEALATMRSKSPTSLKATLKLLRAGRTARSLEACLQNELSAVLHATRQKGDLVEGIRAAVIDKDRNPKWTPPTLAEVTERDAAAFLATDPLPPIPFHAQEACS